MLMGRNVVKDGLSGLMGAPMMGTGKTESNMEAESILFRISQ